MIHVMIDEFTPCLKDAKTGELVQTEVVRIKRRSFLKKYNKKNGWYTDWEKLAEENEIYAVVIEGTVDIQGLVAIAPHKDMRSMYISWMCTAPQNNKFMTKSIKYYGVGGHLFAIVADKSMQWGYEGALHGFAASEELLRHYVEMFHAEHLGMLHQYQFFVDEAHAKELLEVYHYEWNET